MIDDKVSDSDSENNSDNYNNDMTSNNGEIIENVVSENKITVPRVTMLYKSVLWYVRHI